MMRIEDIRKAERQYCRKHPEYFIETYTKMEDKKAPEIIQPFRLWPMQKDTLQSIHTHRLNVILKARQLGITWLALAYAAYLLLLYPGSTVICLSRTEEDAKELIRRLSVLLGHMPELLVIEQSVPVGWSGPIMKVNTQDIQIRFPDAPFSRCKAFPSSPGSARGFTADLLILDEWAFQQYAEEIWQSVFPTINRPDGGKVIGLSTIELGTLFEEIYTNPDNGFNKIFLPWQADPSRNKDWYKETEKALGPEKTRQEYPATPEEALTILGGAFFPEVNSVRHCTRQILPENVRRYVAIDYGLDMLSAHWIAVDEQNRAYVYREYDKAGLTISEAAEKLLEKSDEEEIYEYLGPPDLWNRSQESGKSRAILFQESGVILTRSSNDFEAGCSAMKEWLLPGDDGKPALQIIEGTAPNLFRCLQKIQINDKRPNVYAKEPHALTHDVDSLRYFCVWWTSPAASKKAGSGIPWTEDMLEDYRNADEDGRRYLERKYGFPL